MEELLWEIGQHLILRLSEHRAVISPTLVELVLQQLREIQALLPIRSTLHCSGAGGKRHPLDLLVNVHILRMTVYLVSWDVAILSTSGSPQSSWIDIGDVLNLVEILASRLVSLVLIPNNSRITSIP